MLLHSENGINAIEQAPLIEEEILRYAQNMVTKAGDRWDKLSNEERTFWMGEALFDMGLV